MKEPASVQELDAEYLSFVAAKLLREPVEVTGFELIADPFEFPRFGEKDFYLIPFRYNGPRGEGQSAVILRVMPRMDAVMMLTGDTEHRELKAFQEGLFDRVPKTFHHPYVHVINKPETGQHWAFLEDVRPQMQALGMHEACDKPTMRTILAHLAAFHAEFYEDHTIIDQPWLMSLKRPVDYFYRCVTDILDGMKDPADSSVYVTERWPWLAEGVVNLMDSLPADQRKAIEGLYRNPEALLAKVAPIPKTLCHYDFDNRNLGIEDGPEGKRTVVIDWEILGNGISASDVVRFIVYHNPPDVDAVTGYYLDELERHLGEKVDRRQWREGYALGTIVEWQIRGVLFGVMVSAPSAPVPDDMREPMKERVFADISGVVELVRKHGLG